MPRSIIAILLIALSCPLIRGEAKIEPTAKLMNGYSLESAIARVDSMPLDPIEGVWEIPADGVKLIIERADGEQWHYRAVLLQCDNRSVIPGTVMGYIEPSAQLHKYKLWLYSQCGGGTLISPVSCVATLSDDYNVITYTKPKIKLKLRVNFARWLPNFFRGISISAEPQSETLPEGFRRIAPRSSYGQQGKIIYL